MKSRIKNYIIPGILLAFCISLMFFIYEPITMYSNNVEDFWFDIKTLIHPCVILFCLCFIFIILILSIIYFGVLVFKKEDLIDNKKVNLYGIILIIINSCFISSYIEGNYLAGFLPPLDGSKIIWSDYTKISLVSLLIWLVVLVSLLYLYLKKYKYKIISILKYVNIAICGILLFSLGITLCTTDALTQKEYVVTSTTRNLSKYSSDSNFIVLVLDAVDSKQFNSVVESKEKYKKVFNDFTYYPDTMGVYPFTRDSISFILSGKWNNNETDFNTYYTSALEQSPLLENLERRNYEINIYDQDIVYQSSSASRVKNLDFSNSYNKVSFLKQEIKYVLFKYLPFFGKKYSNIETMDFNSTKSPMSETYDWSDDTFTFDYITKETDLVNEKQFKFIHIEGAHVPFDLDINIKRIEDGTYEQKLEANVIIINKYLNYLKENNIYDNSNIIIMADHGYNMGNVPGRQNPILYIKGVDEHHSMNVSDKAVSYTDLQDAYKDLLETKKSSDLFKNISMDRERRYLYYVFLEEDHMVEYIQTGKAWDTKAMEPTGKEFNR